MKYIISGIAPGFGGVGKLMEYLDDKLDDSKYQIIYPKTYSFENKYIRGAMNQISKRIFFKLKLRSIKNENIVLMHHQTLGLKQTQYLIDNNKSIDFYIMDNAFFCVKSYNYISGQKKECLECIGGNFENALKNNCEVFPVKYDINDNLKFLKYLKEQSQKIKFYTLSDSNALLLKKHFGENTSVKAIYFLTNDILKDQQDVKSLQHNDNGYDIVFHASDIDAKGFSYVQDLATLLPQYTFLIPTSKNISKRENIVAKYMTWETGLKEAVIDCKLVLTPSLWSNTPEAATLKSFLFNGSVGLVNNKYGFANDITVGAYLELSGDFKKDADSIDRFLQEKMYLEYRNKGKQYINIYIENTDKLMKELFV